MVAKFVNKENLGYKSRLEFYSCSSASLFTYLHVVIWASYSDVPTKQQKKP